LPPFCLFDGQRLQPNVVHLRADLEIEPGPIRRVRPDDVQPRLENSRLHAYEAPPCFHRQIRSKTGRGQCKSKKTNGRGNENAVVGLISMSLTQFPGGAVHPQLWEVLLGRSHFMHDHRRMTASAAELSLEHYLARLGYSISAPSEAGKNSMAGEFSCSGRGKYGCLVMVDMIDLSLADYRERRLSQMMAGPRSLTCDDPFTSGYPSTTRKAVRGGWGGPDRTALPATSRSPVDCSPKVRLGDAAVVFEIARFKNKCGTDLVPDSARLGEQKKRRRSATRTPSG